MKLDIVRAWKDESYRQSLSDEQLGQLPENPVGEIELNDTDLESVYGGCNHNGWGSGGNNNRQQNSNICSIICSHNCDINVLDVLDLGLGLL